VNVGNNKTEILIVEDSPTQAEKLRHIIEEEGFQVSVANNGKEALDILGKSKPNIIISDVLMPEMDGYELCKRVRSDKKYQEIPIILLTSLSDPKDVIKGLESGANNFIVKPYDERYLISRIDYLLANLEIRKNSKASMGISIFFAGENYFITAERLQILDLLLSTYENAYHQNLELIKARNELRELNEQLEEKVQERTSELRKEIEERKRIEKRLQYLAYYDNLTGIPNRNYFIERLNEDIVKAGENKNLVAALQIDINRFKFINDTYGFDAGDAVLKEVAERLATSVREGNTIARLGNDEFGILLNDIAQPEDIILSVEKIMKIVTHPIHYKEKEIVFSLSAGISAYPADGQDAFAIIRNADLALGKAKQRGRKTYQFYTEGMDVKAAEFVLMEKDLFNALKNEEFVLYYQPYWDIETKKMVGMEALVRWQSKDKGLVPPGKFIPVLEDTGMIIEVGEWILREAMRQVKEWQNNGHPVVPVSVNMSLVQFRQKDLAGMVKKIMKDSGYYPSLLALEITESAFMQDIEFTKSVLTAMKETGCSVSIDDFGTGYSSLAYLKRFPVDNLKIDISFIREMVKDPDSASIVMAIINMAHTLNLKTIAEGIETEEQWNFLRLLRCDMGQGFYLSKPLPAEDFEKLLI
jgi:diguanylate cyclase (GGDEF)-like protein